MSTNSFKKKSVQSDPSKFFANAFLRLYHCAGCRFCWCDGSLFDHFVLSAKSQTERLKGLYCNCCLLMYYNVKWARYTYDVYIIRSSNTIRKIYCLYYTVVPQFDYSNFFVDVINNYTDISITEKRTFQCFQCYYGCTLLSTTLRFRSTKWTNKMVLMQAPQAQNKPANFYV
jgi:hypothetical protein